MRCPVDTGITEGLTDNSTQSDLNLGIGVPRNQRHADPSNDAHQLNTSCVILLKSVQSSSRNDDLCGTCAPHTHTSSQHGHVFGGHMTRTRLSLIQNWTDFHQTKTATSWAGKGTPVRTPPHYFSSLANQREFSMSL